MKEMGLPFHYVVTVTTRAQRYDEVEGVDYFFATRPQFEEMIQKGELLEWAKVYGNYYGVPRQQVKEALAQGRDVIAKVDVQGASTIKGLVPQAIGIFLAPPSMEELRERLRQRKTEQGGELALRLKRAREEMESLPSFDYVVVNDDLDRAVAQIQAIIVAEKCRVVPRWARL
jgi:guanylate kinase